MALEAEKNISRHIWIMDADFFFTWTLRLGRRQKRQTPFQEILQFFISSLFVWTHCGWAAFHWADLTPSRTRVYWKWPHLELHLSNIYSTTSKFGGDVEMFQIHKGRKAMSVITENHVSLHMSHMRVEDQSNLCDEQNNEQSLLWSSIIAMSLQLEGFLRGDLNDVYKRLEDFVEEGSDVPQTCSKVVADTLSDLLHRVRSKKSCSISKVSPWDGELLPSSGVMWVWEEEGDKCKRKNVHAGSFVTVHLMLYASSVETNHSDCAKSIYGLST